MADRIDYQSLAVAPDQIRLLKTRRRPPPGNSTTANGTLSCELSVYIRNACPSFIALSYAWESPGNSVPVLINGRNCQVGETVEQAIQQLCRGRKKLFVWVDQICINQEDDIEKAHQVQQMRHIYSEARLVVAWLGMPFPHSDILLGYMEELGLAMVRKQLEIVAELHGDPDRLGDLKSAYKHFCQRKYWTRLWIVQEFAVARHVRVVCGNSSIDIGTLEAALWAQGNLTDLFKEKAQGPRMRVIYNQIGDMAYPAERSFVDNVITRRARYQAVLQGRRASSFSDRLLNVLVTSLALESDYNWPIASDPRDRVFALLHLAKDVDDFDRGFVDYTKPCEEVYRETAQRFLSQGHVSILSYCQFPKKLGALPTWVPDWSMEIRIPCADPPRGAMKFRASGATHSRQRIFQPQPGHLSIDGILVDTVKECGEVWSPDWLQPIDYVAALAFMDNVLGLCKKSPRIGAREELLDAVRIASADAITFYDEESHAAFPTYAQDFIGGYHSLMAAIEAGEGPASKEKPTFTDHSWLIKALHRLHSRRPFITATGFVGLCPTHTMAGDVVCIMFGGAIPYMLRPAQNGMYTLVGEAYVHGVMYGELFKGDIVSESFTLK